MATFKKFEEITVWQKARIFCGEIFTVSSETSLAKDYKLKDQITDSSGSIMDNIAEGFGRGEMASLFNILKFRMPRPVNASRNFTEFSIENISMKTSSKYCMIKPKK